MIGTLFIFAVFLILLIVPFMPGIIEFLKPRDAAPLFINKNYTKDPRYFGKSFKYIIESALGEDDLNPGFRKTKLSKNEIVEIAPYKKIYSGEKYNHIFYISGDFVSTGEAQFNKEIYVRGDTAIGNENRLRAIVCMRKVFLSEKVNIVRWIDAEGDIDICNGCNLGISISCGGTLRVSRNCTFKRLYGLPIITAYDIPLVIYNLPKTPIETNNKLESKEVEEISDLAWIIGKKHCVIPPFTRINKDFITKKNLLIKENCILTENVKTSGDLITEENVKIFGNVFSEGYVEIGENTEILGNIFSQGTVNIRKRVTIGNAEKFKSVIGKKGITLSQGVKIYGYVMTEGPGVIV